MNQEEPHSPPWDCMVIGVTGNPGSGKSAAAQLLAEKGARVVSGDELGYEMLQPDSPVFGELVREFGPSVLDEQGGISRSALGQMVFADESRLQRLNAIVHPPMLERIQNEIQRFRTEGRGGPWVLDAALIFEWEIDHWFDRLLVVAAPRPLRKKRFDEMRGDAAQFEKRERAQLPEKEKIKKAHWIIKNDEGLDALREKINRLFQKANQINEISGKG